METNRARIWSMRRRISASSAICITALLEIRPATCLSIGARPDPAKWLRIKEL
jgi:hypothetical protein